MIAVPGRLVNLLYPRRATCMGCGQMLGCERDDLCEECRATLERNWIGFRNPPKKQRLDGTAYAHPYPGPAGNLVRNLKYGSVWILADAMGADIATAAETLHLSVDTLVTAVPMHPKRLRRRGRNHAELLARSAAARLGMAYAELLQRTRNDPQQARLSREQRKNNLRDAFAVPPECRERVKGASVLLIDDVCTSGATARYCGRALRAAGARKVYFVAYAWGGGS